MKYKLQAVILLTCMLFMQFGCKKDYLDRQIGTLLSEQQVFASYAYTERFINGSYAWLPDGFDRINGAMLDAATDDAEHTLESATIQRFNNGSWNGFSNPDDTWSFFYQGIRRNNLFLENADRVNLDALRLDPANQTEYQNRITDLVRWKAEATFLRAYCYFELVKRYGGVPLITKVLSLDDQLSDIQRNSLDECIQFIAAQCDSAAGKLNIFPGRIANDANASGRITKGAALALKSRVLLYAASPLYLQPDDLTDVKPTDVTKWAKAATAAKAVIDLNAYTLLASYPGLYNSIGNTELILARRYGAANGFERNNYPVGYDQGQSGTTPSQNLVDAYEMKDGSAFNWNNPAHAAAPYANRDDRLAQTILLNAAAWKGRPVEAWTGGRDGRGVDKATKTGYYLRKNVAEDVNLVTNTTKIHAWPLFRLAEIYLNYAEALNESDPTNTDILLYLNRVRTRSKQLGIDPGLSQTEMRKRIQNERRIELAFEEHRSWDVRRWKEGGNFFGTPLRGVQITRSDAGVFTYVPVVVENRVYAPKMNWYPIPQNEVIKSKGWKQNAGW
ncbi:RagB/SusD family nutrient uptake outer membrane protein [Chitinophaga sp. SYP-B3965]|uniref:RagB/SusD family nutrient uptake outer membrane protein n=1 Tax=Chitinophaga sp. SYP-B3965 TaxID=2663120 RepID=UPI001C12CE98|nr:RagB/SusD family nutrient uptake outer membrane protein [Chitinophaga sp. SYP-B3965]